MTPLDPKALEAAARECQAAVASTWRRKHDRSAMMFARPEDYAPECET